MYKLNKPLAVWSFFLCVCVCFFLELWLKTCLALQHLAADPLTSYFIVYPNILCRQVSGMGFKLSNMPKRPQGEYKVTCIALCQ
jgi:hypothetical protein